MTDLAVLGTGRMGSAMAVRLCAAGHRVTVWNRSRSRTAAAAAAGARVAGSPAEAVAGADVVITMLADGPAVEAALFTAAGGEAAAAAGAVAGRGAAAAAGAVAGRGAAAAGEAVAGREAAAAGGTAAGRRAAAAGGGAAAAMRPGTVLVQMSTIGPAETAAIAQRLPTGVHFVDAPVGGSIDRAATGELTILTGGEPEAVERAEPVLQHLGTVQRCGTTGTAAAAKLVQNTAMLTALGALHDTIAVAAALGIDEAAALDLLAAGPLTVALRRAASTTADFPVVLAAKDLRLARQALPDAPIADATLRLLAAVPDQDTDIAALIERKKA